MSTIISALSPDMIEMMWPMLEDKINVAIDHSNGELCIHDMKRRLIAGEMLVLTVNVDDELTAAITLEQREFPTGKKVMVMCTAGGDKLEKWTDEIVATCKGLAKDYECSEIYVIGRPGWAKRLKNDGFKTIHTTVMCTV